MANSLNNLIPDIYSAMDVVSRELVGLIPAVSMNARDSRAAVGTTLRVPITPAGNGSDIAPAMVVPNSTDQTVGNVPITITKSRAYEFGFTGEEQQGLDSGVGYIDTRQDMIAQAIRGLVNEVETDLAALFVGASRAFGTAGTTPFASNLSDPANVRKILDDNGAPLAERNLIINTAAGAQIRTLTQLTKANEAGTTSLLNQGVMMDIHGFKIRESAKIKTSTKGTATGYVVNGTHAAGAIWLSVQTGTGTLIAGDVITIAGDTNQYVVAAPLGGGVVTLAAPGLLKAQTTGAAVTVSSAYAANMAFSRNAIYLVARPPIRPTEGDLALDSMLITDPLSGLTFELSMYPGYRKVRYEIALSWGVKMIKPEHCALLLG
jgi:hypothetical protein